MSDTDRKHDVTATYLLKKTKSHSRFITKCCSASSTSMRRNSSMAMICLAWRSESARVVSPMVSAWQARAIWYTQYLSLTPALRTCYASPHSRSRDIA